MEGEEKVTKKKNNLPMLVILIAVVLIAAGVYLAVTDNNDSLKEDDKQDTQKTPQKVVTRRDLNDVDAKSFLDEYKANNLPEETWGIENVQVLGEGLKYSYLVHYTLVNVDGTNDEMETIIIKGEDGTTAELPGWHVGERDLKEYNFTLYSEETPEPTQPEGEQPTEPTNPTDENQPAGGEVPSVEPTQPEGEQPTEPVEQQPTEQTPEVPQE